MTYNKNVFSAVIERFENKREKNREEFDKRHSAAYTKVPKIEQADRELRELSLEAVRSVIKAGKDAEKMIKQFKKKSLNLQAERAELLVTAGFTMNYLDEVFECRKCKDKGFNGASMCDCFRKELKKELYNRSNLGAYLTEQTFKNFDISYFSDKISKVYGISPREKMEKIFEKCKKYAEKFNENSGNLLLIGNTGLGKTFLSTAIARTVLDKGFGVFYDSAQNIFSKIEHNRFKREKDEDVQSDIDLFFETDLLIIDDLGAEFKTQFTESALYNLINSRLILKKPMIINTNLSPEDLEDKYDQRIVSRLTGEFVINDFIGEDIRGKKLARKAEKK